MLEYILRHLGYTDASAEMKERVKDIIDEGEAYLQSYHPGIDWGKPEPFHKSLLKNYCMYALSNASDDFPVNYSRELLKLHAEYEVSKNANDLQDEQG